MARATVTMTLAIEGGTPVRTDPMPIRHVFDEREAAAVAGLFDRVRLEGGSFDRYDGPEVDLYERDLAEFHGARYVSAVSSGTGAIHASLAAAEIPVGSEVLVASFTDPGSVMPVFQMGLVPVFVDHDVLTTAMSPASIEARVGPKTRAIIVTHLHGFMADMDAIRSIATKHGLVVIGDASQAHAATFHGSMVAPFGDIGAVSTMAWKHFTTGGQGGFVATDSEDYYYAAKRFADRGKPFGLDAKSNVSLGLNYRMTELEAVIGRVQLTKLPGVVARRRQILARLQDAMEQTATVQIPRETAGTLPSPYLVPLILDVDTLAVSNESFADALRAEGLPATHRPHMIYDLEFMRRALTFGGSFFPFGFDLGAGPIEWHRPENPGVAELQRRVVIIEPHEGWTDEDVQSAIAAIHKVESVFLGRSGNRTHR